MLDHLLVQLVLEDGQGEGHRIACATLTEKPPVVNQVNVPIVGAVRPEPVRSGENIY